MAIYHFSVKVISRASGRSAVAAAAYRSASRLHDQRLDRYHDFSNKAGVVHSEILLPENAPEAWRDRERLWNEVEGFEKRKDAQLSREVEFAIPREMNQEQGIALARDFVRSEFVTRGMVADLNVHWDIGDDGLARPHAHVMLTMREVSEEGFGPKVRDWNRTELIEQWRERWAHHVNQRLAELDIDARIDHRSLEAQGIDLEPQTKIGPAAQRMAARGLESERIDQHRAIARANGDRILHNPRLALDAITHHQATFTRRDLAMFIHRHSDGKEQFDLCMSAVKASPDLVALGSDGRGEDRFTSRDMIETEQRLQRASALLAERARHRVGEKERAVAIARAESRGLVLTDEQRLGVEHVTNTQGLGVIVGYAGTGKSAMLGVARETWEASGLSVRGLALSGITSENLENGSGIASRTIAAQEHQWCQGRELLTGRDVLVIDEAGMVGTRQMERVLSHAAHAGAKVVLVGDPQQLQAIEAGAAFRAIHEQHGGVEITEVRRQQIDWQRGATRHLATGRTGEAIRDYGEHDMLHATETREVARGDLLDRWDRERVAEPQASRIILAHSNDEVRELNLLARERMRGAGELGEDVLVHATRGERHFARGDRIMFLRNDRSLDVRNGTLGTVERVHAKQMVIRADDGRSVAFETRHYADLDHGYAATIHKAQGMTVDHAHVLATPGMDSHSAYVALSRHRESVQLHYGRDDFADSSKLVRALSRERAKDMATDYARIEPAQVPSISPERAFAERRGITFSERVVEIVRAAPERLRGTFDGLRLALGAQDRGAPTSPERQGGIFTGFRATVRTPDPAPAAQAQREHVERLAVERHARAVAEILKMRDKGLSVLPHQRTELDKAREAFSRTVRHDARDMEQAYSRDPALVSEAASGRVHQAIRAMRLEAEIRTNPDMRADRFVERWQQLRRHHDALQREGDFPGARKASQQLAGMAKSLERDVQVESLLRRRRKELGIAIDTGGGFVRDLAESAGIERRRDRGLSR